LGFFFLSISFFSSFFVVSFYFDRFFPFLLYQPPPNLSLLAKSMPLFRMFSFPFWFSRSPLFPSPMVLPILHNLDFFFLMFNGTVFSPLFDGVSPRSLHWSSSAFLRPHLLHTFFFARPILERGDVEFFHGSPTRERLF